MPPTPRPRLAAAVLAAWLPGLGAVAGEPYTGLWTGVVSLTAVSEPAGANPRLPTPAAGEMRFPLLLHADPDGRISLLKEATLLWRDGPEGEEGGYVLVTDPAVLARLLAEGDGPPSGRRLSTAAMDFPGDTGPMRGHLAPGQTAWTTVEVPTDLPTHPFRHPFHPDHDDGEEVFAITRHIEITFDDAATSAGPAPALAGDYRETLTGLHRDPIGVAGRVTLRRAAAIPHIQR
jgi:hypothetical protein